MTDHRDAITGNVTAEHAKTNPDTTVSEARIRIEPVEFHATYGVTLSGTPSDPAKLTRATGNPNTTVSESPCRECERLRAVVHAQRVAIDGYREEAERLRDSQPIVRTVGDLTARHIGKRVRVETDRTLPDRVRLLREIATASTEAVRLTLEVIDHPEWFLMAHFDLDTPCEVLP